MPQPSLTRVVCAVAMCGGLLLSGLTSCADEPAPSEEAPVKEVTPDPNPEPKPAPEPEPDAFDSGARSIDDPTSIWVVSNKHRPLDPVTYAPDDLVFPEGVANNNGQPLRAEAADAFVLMAQAAEADGVWMHIGSAYRDYDRQDYLYNSYIARDGQAAADTYSARPGHSEHQTGLVVDVDDGGECYLHACFGETAAGMWLAEHAAEYGWVLRYPFEYDHITGFTYEPWHYRYVGTDLALEMRAQEVVTLEEFFGLDPAPDYLS